MSGWYNSKKRSIVMGKEHANAYDPVVCQRIISTSCVFNYHSLLLVGSTSRSIPRPFLSFFVVKSSAGGQNGINDEDASSQLIGITFLFISLCFDGGTGAYEEKLLSVHSVGP